MRFSCATIVTAGERSGHRGDTTSREEEAVDRPHYLRHSGTVKVTLITVVAVVVNAPVVVAAASSPPLPPPRRVMPLSATITESNAPL